MDTPAAGFKRILEVLDRLEIPYLVGGSVASSIHGIPRTTMDADLVVDLPRDRVDEFASELQADFYADKDTMEEALGSVRSFNLIHYKSAYKFDIFPLLTDEFSQTQFRRRRFESAHTFGGEPIECAVATAEDAILSKLCSYRAAGETSSQQWNDIRGILQVMGAQLDLEYLRLWAPRLGVADLLERLFSDRP